MAPKRKATKASSSSSSSSSSEVVVKTERLGDNEDNPLPVLDDSSPTSSALEASIAKKARISLTNQIATESYYCSITHLIMHDPVIAADGHTYERLAILKHLETKDVSPLDNITHICVEGLFEIER